MITTILIVLVAVVVLIVIIAVLALHFLRADDSDTFDDVPAEPRGTQRSPADQPISEPPAARRSRHPEPARAPGREQWANARPADDRSATYRNRDTGPRPLAPDRRNGQPAGSRPPAAAARPGKPAKASGAAKANSWDSLSDVDYWAELSADKPQVGPPPSTPPPAPSNGTARRGPASKPASRPGAEGRSGQRADSGPIAAGLAPAASLPARPRSQSARGANGQSAGRAVDAGQPEQFDARGSQPAGYGNEPTTQSLAALARLSGPQQPARQQPAAPRPDSGQRNASGSRRAAGARPSDGQRSQGHRPAQSAGYARGPVPLDDDPLTSPSFPAVNTSDGRSYRARRSSGAHSGAHTGPQPVAGRSGGYAEPTTQYPAQSRGSQPQTPSSSPVANPYGSYVSTPPPTLGQQADGAWYGAAATGYLPADGYSPGRHNGNGHNGNGHNGNGSGYPAQYDGQGGYGTFDYQNLTYQDVDYQQAQSMAGHAPHNQHSRQFDERAYGMPDLAYGQDGYQGYSGYGPGGR